MKQRESFLKKRRGKSARAKEEGKSQGAVLPVNTPVANNTNKKEETPAKQATSNNNNNNKKSSKKR